MQRVLGIDLGTTNSVTAYVRRGEAEIVPNRQNQESTPSVVARGRRGELLVGAPARGRAGLPDASVIRSVKRFMGRKFASPEVAAVLERVPYRVTEGDDGEVAIWFGDRAYSPTEISSLILGRLKAEAEDRTGLEFPRAVITVPAYFGERQVAATREAGRMAGFHVLKVLDEPTAAALAYGYRRETPDDDQVLLVFDMGGGTFDISVLLLVGGVFTVLCVEGDNLLGGDDFDRLVADRVFAAARDEVGVDLAQDRQALHRVVDAAEQAKIDLSAELETEITLVGVGRPPVTVLHEMSRDEFTGLIRARMDAAMGLVDKAVRGADLQAADIDQVLLVGGSTAIPYVEERLAAMFGRERIRKDIHPMKSVALGAAIQGGLVAEVECAECYAPNPVAADRCEACGHTLAPPPTTTCPTCFLYADAGTVSCPRCGTALDGPAPVYTPPGGTPAHGTVRDGTVRESTVHDGTVRNGGARGGSGQDRPADPTEGGLRCLSCGTVNVAGAAACGTCGEPFESPVEITAQDLGIELHDGSMAVVLPKNTNFPTDAPVSRDFVTAVTDQRRLEIAVYQGGEPRAQDNELCGYLTLGLPPGLPRHSPVNVAFGLNRSRMITVEVRVRALGEQARRMQIQHAGRLAPEDQQRLETHRRSVTRFVDKWSDELSPAEAAVFYQMLEEIDELIVGAGGSRAAVDELTARSDRLVELVSEIRGEDAYLSAVAASAGKYLTETDRTELASYSAVIDEARGRADWGAALVVARQADSFVAGFGPELTNLVFCRTFAAQGRLSPALSLRVQGVAREFDEAYDRDDRAAMDQASAALGDLRPEVSAELRERGDDVNAVTKPQLDGS